MLHKYDEAEITKLFNFISFNDFTLHQDFHWHLAVRVKIAPS